MTDPLRRLRTDVPNRQRVTQELVTTDRALTPHHPIHPFENTNTYSCTSRNTGFDADRNDPNAHDPDAPAALRQMISPRMWNPTSHISPVTWCDNGTYGLPPRVRDMHRRPTTRLEHPVRLREHPLQHRQELTFSTHRQIVDTHLHV